VVFEVQRTAAGSYYSSSLENPDSVTVRAPLILSSTVIEYLGFHSVASEKSLNRKRNSFALYSASFLSSDILKKEHPSCEHRTSVKRDAIESSIIYASQQRYVFDSNVNTEEDEWTLFTYIILSVYNMKLS
jgi:hypothetical protein